MCGIYGSTCFAQFKKLYNLNVNRGNFASGHVYLDRKGKSIHISKSPGQVKYTEPPVEASYYMGHTQSPTGSNREYHPSTTHPFESGNWLIGHNGVINNWRQLAEKYIPNHKCTVDTSIVPALLEMYIAARHTIEEVDLIVQKVLNMIRGTYGVFIYNKVYDVLYVARCGSTMFFNDKNMAFSSTQVPGLDSLPEHILYKIVNEKFTKVGALKNNSSFIIF